MTLNTQQKIDATYQAIVQNTDEARGNDLFKSLCLLLAEKYKDRLEDNFYGQKRTTGEG